MVDPDTPIAPAEDLPTQADAYKDEGNAHFKAGRYKNALVYYNRRCCHYIIMLLGAIRWQ